jgi:osmotically-inducible protein OsmY
MFMVLLLVGTGLFAAPQEQSQADHEAVQRMAQQIMKGILTLPNYSVFDHLTFGIGNGKVYLRGYASRPTLKKSAEQVVKKIEGVTEVINEIEVLPTSRFDDDTRGRTYLAIYGHPALSRYNPNRGSPYFNSLTRRVAGITQDPPIGYHPMHIIVKRGTVILEGVVDNAGDKAIAGMQANHVEGVFQVINDLVVSNQSKEEMKGKKKK